MVLRFERFFGVGAQGSRAAAALVVVLPMSMLVIACFRGGFGQRDGQEDGGNDGGNHDSGGDADADADFVEDAGPDVEPDAEAEDGDLDRDESPGACDYDRAGVVALYAFDEGADSFADALGGPAGWMEAGEPSFVPGPDGCGLALAFPSDEGPFGVIPDDPAWDLEAGSVDFWIRFDRAPSEGFVGIVSRDAEGTEAPGHLTFFRTGDGAVVARIQDTDSTTTHCSEPVPEGRWIHVAANFGPPAFELYVDGRLANRTDLAVFESPGFGRNEYRCGEHAETSIAGNRNPWVLGVNGARGAEGELGPTLSEWLRDGALDHLRISSVRRSFATR